MDLKNLKRKLRDLNKLSFDGVEKSAKHNADRALARMKKDAPYDTGRLKRNIDYRYIDKFLEDDVIFTSTAIDPDDGKDYAPVQEFGSRYIPAHPYFYKNIRKFFGDLNEDLKRKIKNILNKTR